MNDNYSDYIFVTAGTKIIPLNRQNYTYQFFSLKRPRNFIYSYDYSPDEAWLTHEESKDMLKEKNSDTVFSETGYIRIFSSDLLNFKIDGMSEADYKDQQVKKFLSIPSVQQEITKTADTVSSFADGRLFFTLLSDTHYVLNGNWETTAATIETVHRKVYEKTGRTPDGVIHLGDFTDGMLSKEVCEKYSHTVLDRMLLWKLPLLVAIGNHDCNYFKQNRELLSESETSSLYLEYAGITDSKKNYYRYDIAESNLVFFALDSYKNDELDRYGYTKEQLDWLNTELSSLSKNFKVIILSHDAPLAELDYWAKTIRNGEKLCAMLDEWNVSNGHRILGFIHGHTHADYVCYQRTFPVISIGCSKIEYFESYKRPGFIAPPRYENDATQELWDTLIVDTKNNTLDFVRFGAGNDRHIENKAYSPFVWAHRGASGYAPENTLEAFALAEKLGADGVEFDVQYTKDGKLVVIHDETIDRVSDGKGFVRDYTLAQLKQFNFNKTHPEYRQCSIPTLEEVLALLAPTDMTVNIELKTGVCFYPGIEEDVISIVNKFGLGKRVIYSSFNHSSVLKIKKMVPDARCAFLYNDGIADAADYAKKYSITTLHPCFNHLRYPFFVENCKKNGISINVWTVNSEDNMLKCQQYGVNAVITNFPDKALFLYQGKDCRQILNEEFERVAGLKSEPERKKHSFVIHFMGVLYGKIRKPLVLLDRYIQQKAKG